jgi:hypothetical protein
MGENGPGKSQSGVRSCDRKEVETGKSLAGIAGHREAPVQADGHNFASASMTRAKYYPYAIEYILNASLRGDV